MVGKVDFARLATVDIAVIESWLGKNSLPRSKEAGSTSKPYNMAIEDGTLS